MSTAIISQEKLIEYVGIVFCLCVGSWICHIGYYKYMGHPWSAINGPQYDNVNGVNLNFYAYGKYRKLTWQVFESFFLLWSRVLGSNLDPFLGSSQKMVTWVVGIGVH